MVLLLLLVWVGLLQTAPRFSAVTKSISQEQNDHGNVSLMAIVAYGHYATEEMFSTLFQVRLVVSCL